MKYYKVSAMSIDREGMVVNTEEDGSLWVRDEVVDTENQIFSHCRDEYEIEDAYESFWNRTRGVGDYLNKYIVKVVNVELVSDKGMFAPTHKSNLKECA